jgi:hypothetical protein
MESWPFGRLWICPAKVNIISVLARDFRENFKLPFFENNQHYVK